MFGTTRVGFTLITGALFPPPLEEPPQAVTKNSIKRQLDKMMDFIIITPC
jgi:hypothetical protein